MGKREKQAQLSEAIIGLQKLAYERGYRDCLKEVTETVSELHKKKVAVRPKK